MKPTKEQLADPKWWNNNAKLKDKYCYMNEKTGECFTTWHFDDGVHGFELLAKRPEPEWVPEVNKECLFQFAGKDGFDIVTPIFTGKEHVVFIDSKGNERVEYISGNFRPIKTQREEFIDMLCVNNGKTAEVIADAILARFDLTEKDGE